MFCGCIARHGIVPDAGIENRYSRSAAQYVTRRHHPAAIDHDARAEGIPAIWTRDFDFDDSGGHRDPIGVIERHALRRRATDAVRNDGPEYLQHGIVF